MATTSQLLTAEQLAEHWQVPLSHVYRLTRDGQIPVVRLGRYYRYRLDAIERFELGGFGAVDEAVPAPAVPGGRIRPGRTRGRPLPESALTVRA
jgi:excisionase family DNA binding protein